MDETNAIGVHDGTTPCELTLPVGHVTARFAPTTVKVAGKVAELANAQARWSHMNAVRRSLSWVEGRGSGIIDAFVLRTPPIRPPPAESTPMNPARHGPPPGASILRPHHSQNRARARLIRWHSSHSRMVAAPPANGRIFPHA